MEFTACRGSSFPSAFSGVFWNRGEKFPHPLLPRNRRLGSKGTDGAQEEFGVGGGFGWRGEEVIAAPGLRERSFLFDPSWPCPAIIRAPLSLGAARGIGADIAAQLKAEFPLETREIAPDKKRNRGRGEQPLCALGGRLDFILRVSIHRYSVAPRPSPPLRFLQRPRAQGLGAGGTCNDKNASHGAACHPDRVLPELSASAQLAGTAARRRRLLGRV